jgi:hypothetical protein
MQKNCQLVTARLAKCYLIVNSEKSSKSAFLAFKNRLIRYLRLIYVVIGVIRH